MTPGIGKSAIMEEIMRARYRRWWWQFWKPKRPGIVWFNVADMKPTDSAGFLVPYRDDRPNPRR